MITLKRDSLRKKDIARWIATGILTILLLVFLWAAYPGYVFHDYFLSKTMSNRYTSTEVLSGQMMATQYFVPQLPRLYSIQIAAEFDEEKTNGETVTFSLCEECQTNFFRPQNYNKLITKLFQTCYKIISFEKSTFSLSQMCLFFSKMTFLVRFFTNKFGSFKKK